MVEMHIVADNTIPYLKGILEPVASVSYLSSGQFTAEAVKEADVLIVRSVDKCSRSILEGSRVQLITTATIGFDHIDTAYCEDAGIRWTNAPGCNAVSVAQYVLASLICVSQRKQEELKGKTIGIIGVGHVGKEVEKLCTAYGLHVLRNDPPREEVEGKKDFVGLDTIAEEADIITFHTPLTREGRFATWHLADERFFRSLKKNPWFINASRGPVHHTEALLQARQTGKVSDLIIDCWENEPAIDPELLRLSAIATPHIAGFSADGKANATRMCLEEISRFFHIRIEQINKVTPPAAVQPVIDLNEFVGNRIEKALLTSFNPIPVDKQLRETPGEFERFRAHYPHPREYQAYTILNATPKEAQLLKQLGFQLA